jgi:hypothetical protein
MHDCRRSRKGFGLEERHAINDTTTIREGFFRTKSRTDDPLSFPAFRSVLACDLPSRPPASEYAVECSSLEPHASFDTIFVAVLDKFCQITII